jgi:AcrR family transcriptional regulator
MGRDRREPLTRQRIIEAASKFVDEHGADELSMRRLAATLDADAMALYRRVEDKEDLLVGLLDSVLMRLKLPDLEELDWKSWTRELFVRLHQLYADHPNFAPIHAKYSLRSAERPRIFERAVVVLEGAGFSTEDVFHILHLISSQLLGSVLIRLRGTSFAAPHRADGQFERLRAYAPVYEASDLQEEFELCLDLVLDAFEKRLRATAHARGGIRPSESSNLA